VNVSGAGAGALRWFTLVTGPRRSVSLKLSDTRVYEPQIRARLGARWWGAGAAHSGRHPLLLKLTEVPLLL